MTELKTSPETYPYPHKFDVKYNVTDFTKLFHDKTKTNEFLEEQITVAGRVMKIRTSGKHLVFYDIIGDGHKLQVYCNSGNHKGKNSF